jgi:glycosidase
MFFMNKSSQSLAFLMILLTISSSACAEWFYRGSSNGWQMLALSTTTDSNVLSVCQTFSGEGSVASFKIDRTGDWSESYPSSNRVVVDHASYQINFNVSTHDINVQNVADCDEQSIAKWYFRGTPNNWAASEMTWDEVNGVYVSTQTFSGEDSSARYRIDNGHWSESYPSDDRIIDDNLTYIIRFDPVTKMVTQVVDDTDKILSSITVMPSNVSLTVGSSQNISVEAHYTNGRKFDVTSDAILTTSNQQVASITGSAILGVAQGSTVINASFETKSSSAAVVVTQADVLTLKFKKPANWPNVFVHVWDVLPAGTMNDTQWCTEQLNEINGFYSIDVVGATSANVIFMDCNGNKTVDLNRNSSGCYDINLGWTNNCMLDPVVPEIMVMPSSTTFNSNSLSIALNVDGNALTTLKYLIGSGDVMTQGIDFNNGDVITLGDALANGASQDLQVYAANDAGSDTQIYTYTKMINDNDGFSVYLKAWSDWDARIHHWNALPENSEADSPWPGDVMTHLGEGWFKYTFKTADSSNIIFNNAGSDKTIDLNRSQDGCFFMESAAWTDNCDVPLQALEVIALPGSSNFSTDGISVTLQASGESVTTGKYSFGSDDPSLGQDFNTGKVITIGENLSVGDSVTLNVWATDGTTSVVMSYSYTKIEPTPVAQFSWDNATVYFTLTDRFLNGDTSNDNQYGRNKDQNGNVYNGSQSDEGTFHGGDLTGLTQKINEGYFTNLGVNAIWISAPIEQIHGYVAGEQFKHYGYHGYYFLDPTNVDANYGTSDELKTFIDTAHSKGIRIVFDVVLNHSGYETLYDMNEQGFGSPASGWQNEYFTNNPEGLNVSSFNNYLNKGDAGAWRNWWGSEWMRLSGVAGYENCDGGNDITMCLAGLPDFKNDANNTVGLPPLLQRKWTNEGRLNQESAELNVFFNNTGLARTPANYLIKWMTDWVREYGVDGFRVDTAKHVPLNVWKELKIQANAALKEWQAVNPAAQADGQTLDFWMTGEVWAHCVGRSEYFDNGFDSIINFCFQNDATNTASLEKIYASYAGAINNDASFNALSYISSHDTALYNRVNLMFAGNALLMSPGGVQIFYGDETGRQEGNNWHWDEPTRSDMNWDSVSEGLLAHWQKLGTFRANHIAIGAGSHQQIQSSPYTFSRVKDNDKVIVVMDANGATTINTGGLFSSGTVLTDAYTGNTAVVNGGTVTFNAHSNGVILISE